MVRVLLGPCSFLVFSVICTQAAEIKQNLISSVEIRGAPAAIPFETKSGDVLDTAKLQRDVKALWRSGRFSDIHVESVDNGHGMSVIFKITEKPVIRLRKVEINPATPGVNLNLEPSSAVDELRSQQIAMAVRKQLESSGYPDAKVVTKMLPAGRGWADLQVNIDKGRNVRIKEVTLTGELGVKPSVAMKALRATTKKTMLPAIPGIWKGWKLVPDYTESAVQSDMASLRSFYYKKGYFDANVNLNSVDIGADGARIDVAVRSGARYGIRQINLLGADGLRQIPTAPDGVFPVQNICTALLAERRKAERDGVLDFTARIEIREAPDAPRTGGVEALKWADLTATVQRGPAYRVGRIEFRGNRSFSDLLVRRMFLINEGELLDEMLLRKSLGRLNRTGFFEPLAETDVVVNTAPGSDRADLTVSLKEKKARHWYLSGPVGPMSIAGPLRFSIGSRLPAWGQGIFELASYTASMNLVFFAKPLNTILPIFPNKRFFPELTIRRPLLPGQNFLSGFTLAPQFGWKGMLAGYAISHSHEFLGGLLQSDRSYTPGLPVTIAHAGSDAPENARMFCELPKTKKEWALQIGGISTNLFFSFMPF